MRKDGKEQERENREKGDQRQVHNYKSNCHIEVCTVTAKKQMNLESSNRVHRHRIWLVHHHKILIRVENLNWVSQHLQVMIVFLTCDIIACLYTNTC